MVGSLVFEVAFSGSYGVQLRLNRAFVLHETNHGTTSSFITYAFHAGVWVQITNTNESDEAKSYVNGVLLLWA